MQHFNLWVNSLPFSLHFRQKMAKYLWQQGSEPLPSALAASWIFGVLAHKLPNYESDLIKSYEKNKEYVCHAIDSVAIVIFLPSFILSDHLFKMYTLRCFQPGRNLGEHFSFIHLFIHSEILYSTLPRWWWKVYIASLPRKTCRLMKGHLKYIDSLYGPTTYIRYYIELNC